MSEHDLYREEIWWLFWGVIATAGGVIGSIVFEALSNRREEQDRILGLVKDFSKEIKDLKNEERTLKTKLDCETYAISYLDLLDQIAFLYNKGAIPRKVREYFDNDFSYALTILTWINKHEISLEQNKEKGQEWKDLFDWCNKPGKEIEEFDESYLPPVMINYEKLPREIDTDLLDLVREYSKELTTMIDKEKTIKTKLDCEIYANNYLDLLDQIAFLHDRGSIPNDIGEYFSNYFSYALTLLEWMNKHIRETKQEPEEDWIDLDKWCTNNEIIEFDEDSLPEKMKKYETLPE